MYSWTQGTMNVLEVISERCFKDSAAIVSLRAEVVDKNLSKRYRECADRTAAMYEGFLINKANMMMDFLMKKV